MILEQSFLLQLVRLGINQCPNVQLCSDVHGIDWHLVYSLSVQQGVVGIVLDGIQRLPKGEQDLLKQSGFDAVVLKFASDTISIEKQFERRQVVLNSLVQDFKVRGIDMLLLKGNSLSGFWPVPNHRPCGDIDFYLFGQFAQGNEFFRSLGELVHTENPKHSESHYKGAMVENHFTLFNVVDGQAFHRAEQIMPKTKGECILTDAGYYVLPPLPYYIFLLRHLARHFSSSEGVTIRQLIDFALFIRGNMNSLVVDDVRCLVESAGLLRINDLMVSVASDLACADLSAFVFGKVSARYKRRILDDLFVTHRFEEKPSGAFRLYFYKGGLLFAKLWKFRLLPESFWTWREIKHLLTRTIDFVRR